MPRGFLVKRTQKHHATGARLRVAEEEDRNECGYGSELDSPLLIHTSSYPYPYGSPDSGFSQSPVNLSTKSTRQSDVDGQKYEDGQSDCQSTSGKETLASDVSSGSDLDDAHVQVKGEERSSPKTTNGSESRFGEPRATCYGLPQHVAPSALSIATSTIGSPQFYFSAFDRLSVTSPKGYGFPRNAPPYLRAAGLYTGFPSMAAPGRIPLNSPASPAGVVSPNKRKSPENHNSGPTPKAKSAKKPKAARKINFDEDKSSPVSGTIIRDPSDVDEENGIRVVSGDIDASLNFVEVTPEAREELAKIENRIGAYICQLCKEHYEDAFQLAQHRCSRIIHVEYRCPECDKVFNCPANLASHRRWHKPRPNGTASNNNNNNNNSNNNHNNNNNNNNNNNSSSQNHNDNGGKDKNNSDMKRTLNAINGNISGRSLHPAVFLDGMTKLMGRGVENLLQAASAEGQIADSESLFECEKCGKKFRRQAYLRKHLSTHVTAGSEPATTSSCCCPICGKAFGSEPSRAEHALLFHGAQSFEPKSSRTRADEFGCALCGRSLGNQLELEHHQRLQHPNEVYACKYCTAVFYSSPGLTRHTNKCHPAENRRVILLQMQPPSMSQINSPC